MRRGNLPEIRGTPAESVNCRATRKASLFAAPSVVKGFVEAFAMAVVAHDEADPVAGITAIHRNRSRAEFEQIVRTEFLLAPGNH